MKKLLLLSGALLGGALAMQAFDSPYKGVTPEAGGQYYLYNVETGLWIDANSDYHDQWTAKAIAKGIGRLFEARVAENTTVDDGVELYGWYWNCGSINKAWDAFLMDCSLGDGITTTYFVPEKAETDNDNIGFTLKYDNGDGTFRFLTVGDPDGWEHAAGCQYLLPGDDATSGTWQFVTREERLAKMVADAKENTGGVDATWLINGYSVAEHDCRMDAWCGWQGTDKTNIIGNGNGWRAMEYWNTADIDRWMVIQGLPAGTYEYAVEGYNRDGNVWTTCKTVGPFENNGWYYINADARQLKNVFDEAKDAKETGFEDEVNGKWFPSGLERASYVFHNGYYHNEPASTVIGEGGQIVVGLSKHRLIDQDSYVIGRMSLRYKASTEPVDYSAQIAWIDGIIARAKEVAAIAPVGGISDKIAELEALKEKVGENTFGAVSQVAYSLMAMADDAEKAVSLKETYLKIKELIPEGTDISKAEAIFAAASNSGEYLNALQEIRGIHRRANARRVDLPFEGTGLFPEGQFYLYNVGQKQFYGVGGEWRCHPVLDDNGQVFTAANVNLDDNTCNLMTTLKDGAYLATWGSMDYNDASQMNENIVHFVPVDGQENTFAIYMGTDDYHTFTPHAPQAGRTSYTEHNIDYYVKSPDLTNPDTWWKIVTIEEREAMKEAKADKDNGVDVSYLLANPSFNYFIGHNNVLGGWTCSEGLGVAGHGDFLEETAEAYNDKINAGFNVSQTIENVPYGAYVLSVEGYHRNGAIDGTIDDLSTSGLELYGPNGAAIDLCSIIDGANKAPGEGTVISAEDGTTYEVPNSWLDAACFYRAGQYLNQLIIMYTDPSQAGPIKAPGIRVKAEGDDTETKVPFTIGVRAKAGATINEGGYVNLDNFRLAYYGNTGELPTGIGDITTDLPAASEAEADTRIYNLQGIRVAEPAAPGIYIRGGKKFVVK